MTNPTLPVHRLATGSDGSASVDGHPIDTAGAVTPEAAAVGWVADRAREHGAPIPVTATDAAGLLIHLMVHPDGHSELAAHRQPPHLQTPRRRPPPSAVTTTEAPSGIPDVGGGAARDVVDVVQAVPGWRAGNGVDAAAGPAGDGGWAGTQVPARRPPDAVPAAAADPAAAAAPPAVPVRSAAPTGGRYPAVQQRAFQPLPQSLWWGSTGVPDDLEGGQPDPVPRRDSSPPGRSAPRRPEDWATAGWQGWMCRWSAGHLSPSASSGERHRRALVNAVRAPLGGGRLVVVVNPKGGSGKTAAVVCTAATWAAQRPGVAAWDLSGLRGPVGLSAPAGPRVSGGAFPGSRPGRSRPVLQAPREDRPPGGAPTFDLVAWPPDLRQPGALDAVPSGPAPFDGAAFSRVRELVTRSYAVSVLDTGDDVASGSWQAAVGAADQLLVVSSYSPDSVAAAWWTLDHLHATGRGELADRAVTVFCAAGPACGRRARAVLCRHFQARTRAVLEVPYDPAVARGGHVDPATLLPGTREAWLAVTAALTAGLSR